MRPSILSALVLFHLCTVFAPPARAADAGTIAKEVAGGFLGVVVGAAVASIPALVYLPFHSKNASPNWTDDEGMMLTLGLSVGAAITLIPFTSAYGIHQFGGRSGSFERAYKGSWLGCALGFVPCGPLSFPFGPPAYGTWFYERSKSRGRTGHFLPGSSGNARRAPEDGENVSQRTTDSTWPGASGR